MSYVAHVEMHRHDTLHSVSFDFILRRPARLEMAGRLLELVRRDFSKGTRRIRRALPPDSRTSRRGVDREMRVRNVLVWMTGAMVVAGLGAPSAMASTKHKPKKRHSHGQTISQKAGNGGNAKSGNGGNGGNGGN